MKVFNADLHYHSPQAAGVSKNMSIPLIAEQAKLKGLHMVVTADITNAKWFTHVKQSLVEENGCYVAQGTDIAFLVGTEVQCDRRVHHLTYFPTLEASLEFKEHFKGKAVMDSFGTGRPVLRSSAEEIALRTREAGGIIGPAHAFTPYFGAYAKVDSLQQLYGTEWENIHFMELGLSADTAFADLIQENHRYTFLSNSDSHSPWPHRIGREFNRMEMKKPNFKEFRKVVEEKEEKHMVLNVGLDPREGKYHCTACSICYEKYTPEQEKHVKGKCHCGGMIVKGVRDRIQELATFTEETHPAWRPEYVHQLPLAEIIQITLAAQNPLSKKVQELWAKFVEAFGTEINALVDAQEKELREVHAGVAESINAFREGWVLYLPGGGGSYGTPLLCKSLKEKKEKELLYFHELHCINKNLQQKKLGEF